MSEPSSFDLKTWQNFNAGQENAAVMFWKYKYLGLLSGMGSGKSYWIRAMAVEALMTYFAKYVVKGIQIGIFCEDYPSLQGRHILKLKEHFPSWMGDWVESRRNFELKPEYGGGIIAFRSLDNVSKYDSEEFAVIFVDEGQKNRRSDFDTLRRRLRWPNLGDDVHFAVTGNPPKQNEDPWMRDIFVDRLFSDTEAEAEKFGFAPLKPAENQKHLPKDYFLQFSGMSEAERAAFLDGDPHAFDNVMSDDGWRPLLAHNEVKERTVSRLGGVVAPVVLGIDPGGGGDETSFVLCDEFHSELVFNQKTVDTLVAVPIAIDIIKTERVTEVVVDKTGLGWAFYLRLKEVVAHDPELRDTVTVRGIGFGEKSRFPKRFKNLKAELFWLVREWALGGGKFVADDSDCWRDLSQVRYKMDSERFVELEKKDDYRARGLKSMNVLDALALTCFSRRLDGSVVAERRVRGTDNTWKTVFNT